MDEDNDNITSSDTTPLEPWVDPALEARLVAFVLGEASDFEAAELQEALDGQPELQAFHDRIKTAHETLQRAEAPPSGSRPAWRLPSERRAMLLERFRDTAEPAERSETSTARPLARMTHRHWRTRRAAAIGIAATIALLLVGALVIRLTMKQSVDFDVVAERGTRDLAGSGFNTVSPQEHEVSIVESLEQKADETMLLSQVREERSLVSGGMIDESESKKKSSAPRSTRRGESDLYALSDPNLTADWVTGISGYDEKFVVDGATIHRPLVRSDNALSLDESVRLTRHDRDADGDGDLPSGLARMPASTAEDSFFVDRLAAEEEELPDVDTEPTAGSIAATQDAAAKPGDRREGQSIAGVAKLRELSDDLASVTKELPKLNKSIEREAAKLLPAPTRSTPTSTTRLANLDGLENGESGAAAEGSDYNLAFKSRIAGPMAAGGAGRSDASSGATAPPGFDAAPDFDNSPPDAPGAFGIPQTDTPVPGNSFGGGGGMAAGVASADPLGLGATAPDGGDGSAPARAETEPSGEPAPTDTPLVAFDTLDQSIGDVRRSVSDYEMAYRAKAERVGKEAESAIPSQNSSKDTESRSKSWRTGIDSSMIDEELSAEVATSPYDRPAVQRQEVEKQKKTGEQFSKLASLAKLEEAKARTEEERRGRTTVETARNGKSAQDLDQLETHWEDSPDDTAQASNRYRNDAERYEEKIQRAGQGQPQGGREIEVSISGEGGIVEETEGEVRQATTYTLALEADEAEIVDLTDSQPEWLEGVAPEEDGRKQDQLLRKWGRDTGTRSSYTFEKKAEPEALGDMDLADDDSGRPTAGYAGRPSGDTGPPAVLERQRNLPATGVADAGAEKKQADLSLETLTASEPFSTFSLNVSDVSFKLSSAALLEQNTFPPAAKVRVDEFVNAFDYGDPAPSLAEKVACQIDQAVHPFLQQRNLMRVSMRTAAAGRSASQPLRLTILLDRSGSMEREDREQSVLRTMQALAKHLGPADQVTAIAFARTPRLIADRLGGERANELVGLVAATPSEGGTNLEEALKLAESLAARQFEAGGTNRIVLITDGAANLGDADPESLKERVINLRQQGIAFDACGVGADGLNDATLEALTRKGDGRYYFLNRPEDADANFVRQLAGSLRPAAKNVKVQVKFNPERVTRYRLAGFEKHRLNKEDFRNDKVDAAEMAAAEAGNALYQFEADPQGRGDIGEVSVRFLDTSTNRMVERTWPIPYQPKAPRLKDAASSMRLAATAGLLAEKLKGDPAAGAITLRDLSPTTNQLRAEFAHDQRVHQLIQMVEKARSLGVE